MTPTRADTGIYARVSAKKKRSRAVAREDVRSVSEQLEGSRVACDELGWTVRTEYLEEEGRSASRYARKDRPEWNRLVSDLGAGDLDAIVLWESSRGDRTLGSWVTFLDECRERGVLIHVVKDEATYDVRKPRDYKTLASEGVDNSHSSEETHQRVSRAKAAGRRAGRPDGRLPFGYRREYDPDTGELLRQVPHETEAPVVRYIFESLVAGHALARIRRHLNTTDAPTMTPGVPWTDYNVRRVARRPCYIGKVGHKGQIAGDAQWKAIVSEADWWTIQGILDDPARRTAKSGAVRHMLSGVAKCGRCGGWMRPNAVNGNPVYRCGTNNCTAIRRDWLNEFISDIAIKRLIETDLWDRLMESDDTFRAAMGEAKTLRGRIEEAFEGYKSGVLTMAEYGDVKESLTPMVDAAEARAKSATAAASLRPLMGITSEEIMRAAWNAMPVEARKEACRLIFVTIEIQKSRPGRQRIMHPDRVAYETI
jgi:site-specific DNA recombinase